MTLKEQMNYFSGKISREKYLKEVTIGQYGEKDWSDEGVKKGLYGRCPRCNQISLLGPGDCVDPNCPSNVNRKEKVIERNRKALAANTAKSKKLEESSYYDDRENTVSDVDRNILSPADRLAAKKEREASKLKGALSTKTTEGIAKAIFAELKLNQYKGTPYKDLDKDLRIKIGNIADEYEENSKSERDAAKGDKEKLKTAKVVLASELTAKIREMLA